MPGIYTNFAGYVIILRKNMRYQICDAIECIVGIYTAMPASYDKREPERKYNLTLKYVFKTALGSRMEFVTYYQQYQSGPISAETRATHIDDPDVKERIEAFRYSDSPESRFNMYTAVVKCHDLGDVT